MITPDQRRLLEPYIAGAKPDGRGEVMMYCPLHRDSKRSVSINLDNGAWYCFAGCGGGSLRQLCETHEAWIPAEGRANPDDGRATRSRRPEFRPTPKIVKAWNARFMEDEELHLELLRERGIEISTAKRAILGYDGKYYKIPVFSPNRNIWNVRTYDMHLPADSPRRKIWSVREMGQPRLYPIGVVHRASHGSAIVVCEGEWDALFLLQEGIPAITRTGSADVWKDMWSKRFKGLQVYVCHDMDKKGQKANRVVAESLKDEAAGVKVIQLPSDVTPDHGYDVTDFLLGLFPGERKEQFKLLMKEAIEYE